MGVAADLDQRLGDLMVEADVEDGVHHARHRELGAGAARDEQRVGGITELLAGLLLDMGERLGHLVPHAVGNLPPASL